MSINQLPLTNHHSAFPWATALVSALAAAGLRRVCVAPGSRSTPLTLAFAAHPDVALFLHLDERSAGFFALGLGLADDAPAALVCTSGTAVANFLPAIVEARMSHVPLLVLTADRPPELRHSGANQTIDQVKIYGDQVLWSVDAPLPEADPPAVVLRHLHTLAARALATANGLPKGPVHLNLPFRKPLEPASSEQYSVFSQQYSADRQHAPTSDIPNPTSQIPNPASLRVSRGMLIPTRAQLAELAELANRHERGLIVCGPRCPGGPFPQAVAGLAQLTGWPILADPLSGVRWGRHTSGTAVLGGYETYLQQHPGWPEPDVVLRFGAVPTSKWLNAYLDGIRPAQRIHVRGSGAWADDSHRTTWLLQVDETALCLALAPELYPRMHTAWTRQLLATETAVWQALDQHLFDPYFDASVVADTVAALPDGARLFAGNSLPVRHLDQWARPSTRHLLAYANRGASGIDGNVSTALGIGAASSSRAPLVALLGDITFYHDLNGLLAVRGAAVRGAAAIRNPKSEIQNLTIVLLNNNGGGIFRRLPVQNIEPPFTDLFVTPHGLDFSGVIGMYGLAHERPQSRAAFQAALAVSLANDVPTVIEVRTDGEQDEARRREVGRMVNG